VPTAVNRINTVFATSQLAMVMRKSINKIPLSNSSGISGFSKDVGLGKFWPHLEIMKAFVIDFKVLFSGDFSSRSLEFF